MSDRPSSAYLDCYPPFPIQCYGPPAHVVSHSQQILRQANVRPPPNIVAHAEKMVAEEARRRQMTSSRPSCPPPPPYQVYATPQVVRPLVIQHPVRFPVQYIPQYYPPPSYWLATQQVVHPYSYPFVRPQYVPGIQQLVQTSNTLTQQTDATLIEQLWGGDTPTTAATVNQNATPTATADVAQPSTSEPGNPSTDTPSPNSTTNDLSATIQASLTTLYQTPLSELRATIQESMSTETERLMNQIERLEIASKMRLSEYVRRLEGAGSTVAVVDGG